MSVLSREQLNHDRNAAVTMDEDAVAEVMESLDGWIMKNPVGVPRVEKVYSFADFKAALAFTVRVGELAESAGHHPSLLTEWGKVTVGWWSHSLGGIHRNDLIMAARTDDVLPN